MNRPSILSSSPSPTLDPFLLPFIPLSYHSPLSPTLDTCLIPLILLSYPCSLSPTLHTLSTLHIHTGPTRIRYSIHFSLIYILKLFLHFINIPHTPLPHSTLPLHLHLSYTHSLLSSSRFLINHV